MEVGTIQKWHVEEGGSFGEGDTICEIETDKATIDFTAQDEGVVARLLQPEGTEIAIGTPILVKVEDAADVGAFAAFEAPARARRLSSKQRIDYPFFARRFLARE